MAAEKRSEIADALSQESNGVWDLRERRIEAWRNWDASLQAVLCSLSARPMPDRRTCIQQEDSIMRTIVIPVALAAALATGTAVEPVQAKGCIKGAIVGGIAGHAAGHGILGAAGGCVAGRALANRAARQRELREQQQMPTQQDPQTGQVYTPSKEFNGGQTNAPSTPQTQGYTSGAMQPQGGYNPGAAQGQGYNANAMQNQGYAPSTQGQSYTPNSMQTNTPNPFRSQ